MAVRDKEHSTIIYESPQPDTPLLRLGWNKQDPRYMATILMDSSTVVVLDIRYAMCLSSNFPVKKHGKEHPPQLLQAGWGCQTQMQQLLWLLAYPDESRWLTKMAVPPEWNA